MSMTLDAMPDAPPPLADYAQVPIGSTQAAPETPPVIPAAPAAAPVAPGPDLGQLTAQLAEIQRQKNAANEPQYAKMQATIARDQERVSKAYDQAGIGPDDLPQWNADEARDKFKYDPIQAFGSIGSVFAIIASAFTNRPMQNAMMGAAAAMNAQKEGNAQEYDRAYKAWQDNTKLAINRQNIQNQQYQNAVSLFNTDMAAGKASLAVNAAKFGDKQAQFLLENGLDKDLIDMLDKRQQMSLKLAEVMPKIEVENLKSADLKARTAGLAPGSQEFSNAVIEHRRDWSEANVTAAQRYLSAAGREYDANTDGPYSEYINAKWDKFNEDAKADTARKMSEPQKAFKAEIQAKFDRDPTSEEWIDFNQRNGAKATKDTEFIKRRTVEIAAEREGAGTPVSDTQAEKLAREELTRTKTNPAVTERLGSIEKAKAKWLQEHPEANGDMPSEIENQIRANAYRAVSNASIDDKTARLLAEQVVAGRYQAVSGLGYGGVGAANRAKVFNIVSEIADERGLSGADIARQAIEFQATGRGASSLAQLEARTTGAITKAQATAPRVLDISDQIDRTRYPKINDIILAAQKNVGGEKVVRLGAAVETFINNYAMALGGGSAVMTDASKQHARALLETGYSKGQMHAAVDQMMIEMESELAGIKRGLSTYLAPPQKEGGSAAFRPPQDWEYSEKRQQYRDPSGAIYDKNGKKVQ